MPTFTINYTQYRTRDHHGTQIIRETKPADIAILNADQDPTKYIILHPRYVPDGFPHERKRAMVCRQGRTLDLFFEDPVMVGGKEHFFLNYKGVGAEADFDKMLIVPGAWHVGIGVWKDSRDIGGSLGRVWGGLRVFEGEAEYRTGHLLKSWGMSNAEHVGVNVFPQEVMTHIENDPATPSSPLCQLVRAYPTNVRLSHRKRSYFRSLKEDDLERTKSIAIFDARYILAQQELARQGKMLSFFGSLAENRLCDGSFLDAENYSLIPADSIERRIELKSVLISSMYEHDKNLLPLYLETLYSTLGPHMHIDAKKVQDISSLTTAIVEELKVASQSYVYRDAPKDRHAQEQEQEQEQEKTQTRSAQALTAVAI